ncbi:MULTISPECIES: YflJ family protein [Bacillaceae]|uniref:YflJ family protein n=1 Tax=Bacillaceae TaxID=186817 RepID=UPI002A13E873|nr:YflJ family protein [Cytobacillus sp. IB215316]MDX8361999.1 YflJ family protein [Cytobacillus sp. IB215316]
MAYPGSKGWYVKQLKDMGINIHPTERRRLELYKTSTLRNLYLDQLNKTKNK